MCKAFLFLLILLAAAVPLGWYIKEIMQGKTPRFVRFIQPIERLTYRVIGSVSKKEMTAKTYLFSVLAVSVFSIIGLTGLLMVQHWLPQGAAVENMSFDLALNTAVSFVTNTNWQAYAGESIYQSFPSIRINGANFVSAAVGLAVLCALICGLQQKQKRTVGNFWKTLPVLCSIFFYHFH